MLRRSIALFVLSLAALACATPTATLSPSPSPTAPPPSGATTIELHRVAGDLGCDTIGIDYTSFTFHIDPGAVDQVIALTNKAATLKTYWSDGFVPGTDAERVIRDATGAVVATDGQVVTVPAAAYPRLAGHFVCLGTDAIYVFGADPS